MKAGDNVEWTKTVRRGSGFEMKQRCGKIISIHGDQALVKPERGKQGRIGVSRLHVTGSGPNQLTRLLDAMAKND